MKLHLPQKPLQWLSRAVLIASFSFLCWVQLPAQALQLSLPEVTVADGETISLPLTVSNFDSIVSLQLSINWNTAVATYVDFELDALPLLAIGDFQADEGELRLSWFDNTGNGRTLPDGTIIAHLRYTAMGEPGDFTLVSFTGMPLEIQIFKATGVPGVFEPVDLEPNDGRIAIGAPLGFSLTSSDVSCFGAADGSALATLEVDPDDYNFSWTGPDGFFDDDLTLNNLSGGVYTLTITDQGGVIVFTYELIISEAEAPLGLASLTLTESSCETASGTLDATATGGTSPYSYTLNGIGGMDGRFTNLSAGNYSLLVVDNNGCEWALDTMIVAPDAPVINLPSMLSICNEALVLSPEAEGSYQWSTGEMTDSISVSTAGSYSVTVTNMANCSASATVEVTQASAPTAMLDNDFLELCPGDSLQLMVSGGDMYNWLQGKESLSDTTVFNPMAFPDTTTNYQVAVANACGADTLAFSLLVYDILASAGQDTCIAPGDEAQLLAIGGIFYNWMPSSFPVSNPDIPNPTASPKDSTTYQVTITDINGCVTVDEVTVLVANDPVTSITPYNLITPNGDGFNDELEFGEILKFGSNSLKIYNRWGDLIYQKLNYQSDEERFAGLYKGERLPGGNYFYVLAFRQGEVKQTLTIVWE